MKLRRRGAGIRRTAGIGAVVTVAAAIASMTMAMVPMTVGAATAGAAFATVISLLLSSFWDVPTGFEGALATVFAFAAGYLTPPRGA